MASTGPRAGIDYAVPPMFATPGQSLATPWQAARGGHVYFAKKSTDYDYGEFLALHYQQYGDGTVSVYNTVQAANDAISAATTTVRKDRGDVLYVCSPSQGGSSANTKINENAYITIPGLKIFALSNWWECQWRASDGATKYPYTPTGGTATQGVCLILLNRGIEVAGFLFDGGGGYTGVYVGDGYNVTGINALGFTNQNSAACYIHDCIFQGGNEGQYGIQLDGCSADVIVERCVFNQWDNAGIYITPGGSRTCQHPIIRHCSFWAAPGGGYGVDMYSSATTVGVNVDSCVFRDGAAAVFTNPIRFQGAGVNTITNCTFACTNAWSAPATDWQSNNSRFNIAGNTTTTTTIS